MSMSGVVIFGDSLMKATAPDAQLRPHFNIKHYGERLQADFDLPLDCRASFGATVSRGLIDVQNALNKGVTASHGLLEYGGNDCDFDWAAVAADPGGQHLPKTPLPQFVAGLELLVQLLQQAGITPVLLNLPPIHAERYLAGMVQRGLDGESILRWLGGDAQMIYHYQELYSHTVEQFAAKHGLLLIDIRTRFLGRHDFPQLLSPDGIHPTLAGYDLIYAACADFLRRDGSAWRS